MILLVSLSALFMLALQPAFSDERMEPCEALLTRYSNKLEETHRKAKLRFEQLLAQQQNLPELKRKYYQEILAALEAALTKHYAVYINARRHQNLDYGRYFTILERLSELDVTNPTPTLFQIRRLIEGRYSIKEFTQCR